MKETMMTDEIERTEKEKTVLEIARELGSRLADDLAARKKYKEACRMHEELLPILEEAEADIEAARAHLATVEHECEKLKRLDKKKNDLTMEKWHPMRNSQLNLWRISLAGSDEEILQCCRALAEQTVSYRLCVTATNETTKNLAIAREKLEQARAALKLAIENHKVLKLRDEEINQVISENYQIIERRGNIFGLQGRLIRIACELHNCADQLYAFSYCETPDLFKDTEHWQE